MKTRPLTLATLCTLAICQSQSISAQAMGGGPGPMSFSEADLNGDGKITEQELYQTRTQRMAKMSQQGYPMRMAGQAPNFADMDMNGDGSIGPDEFQQAQAQHMQRMRGAGMGPPGGMPGPGAGTAGQSQ